MRRFILYLLPVMLVSQISFGKDSSAKKIPSQKRPGFTGFEKNQSAVSFFAGQPTFFRYDKFINWKRAWSVDFGYHFDKYPYLAANYVVYFNNIRDRLKGSEDFFNSLLYYGGPGVFLGPDFEEEKSSEKVKIGLRAFVGSEYIFRNSQWSLKAEVAPVFFIEGQDNKVGFQGMLGITYYIGGIKTRKLKSRISNVRDNTEIKVKALSKEEKSSLDDEFKEFD